jgi:hypothetical protein
MFIGVISFSSLSITPPNLHNHSFILSLSSRSNNTTVRHIQFEGNAQLIINLLVLSIKVAEQKLTRAVGFMEWLRLFLRNCETDLR